MQPKQEAIVTLLMLALGSISHAAPTVRLSGTVRSSGGAVLAGVDLVLKGVPNVTAATGANGAFLLKSEGGTGVERPEGSSPRFSLVRGELLVAARSDVAQGRLDIFATDGRLVHSVDASRLDGGAWRVGLSSFLPGLNLVRVEGNGNIHRQSVLRLDGRLVLLGRPSPTETDNILGARSMAAAVDTLIARKAGYQERKVPIAAYVDSNLAITMDSVGSGKCPAPKPGTSKSNPIFTDVYSADPGVMVDNCTFYIQAGHDEGTGGFVMREWFLFKSTDMVNWTRTTPMTLKIFAWTNANAWAGQMIKARNGKYYWYVPINDIKFSQDRMAIGVAVADSPEGPWKDALGKPIVNDSLEMATFGGTNIDQTPHTIDPTVFIDDDGQAYLQYGGFWTMVSVKLNPDMISLSGKLVKTTPFDYFESPYLIKRNGVYYQIYARGAANPTTIDYATSNNPQGPWTHKGTILGKMPKVAGQDETTNHAGVAEFAGQWYIVYHVSNGPNGGGTYRRMVAIDKLFFNADGTIQPVTPSAALKF